MVNREQLKDAGLRAYELGRLRSAFRAAWLLVPVAVVCALETGAGEPCACIGSLLLGAAVFFRWRDRQGVESVRDGLLAGSLPLLAGLVMARVAPNCAGAPLWSLCTAISLSIGIPAGAWLGLRAARATGGAASLLVAAGISVLAASLGCIALGVAGIAGAILGLILGATSATVIARVTG
jgi:hypothetical protein